MDDQHYCNDLVRRRDEDRWLSAQYAPEGLRNSLIALYAFHQELVQIPIAVSEPPLGEIRLQWWREALDEILAEGKIRAHPVVQALAQAGIVTQENRTRFEEAIDARAHVLYGEGFVDLEAYLGWLEKAEGYLAGLRQRGARLPDGEGMMVLIRAESLYGSLVKPNNLSEPYHAALATQAAEISTILKPVLEDLPPEQSALHLHLCLLKGNVLTNRSPLAGISKRVRLFFTMATGRF